MRTLVSYLNEKTPQDLRTIAELWEVSLTERLYNGNSFQLAQELQSEFLQRRLLEKLDEANLKVLAYFVARPAQGVTLEDIVIEGLTAEDIKPSVQKLRLFGLIYHERIHEDITVDENVLLGRANRRGGWNDIYGSRKPASPITATNLKMQLVMPRELARPFARLLDEKQNNKKENQTVLISHLPLPQLLERLEPELIESMTEPWGIAALLGEAKPNEIAAELARAMNDAYPQQKVLEELPEESQELFQQLKNLSGRTSMSQLRQEFVTIKRLGRNLRPLIEHLLVWEVFEDGESLVFIPAEITSPGHRAKSETAIALQTVAEPLRATTYPPYALAWDTLTFLNYIGQNEVELTNQSYIPKRHIKKIGAMYWESGVAEDGEGSPRFSFMLALTDKLKLYEIDSLSRRMFPGPGLDEWLGLDILEQTRKFFEHWLNTPFLSSQVPYPYYYRGNGVVEQTNKTIIGWLTQCQPEVWYSLASLLNKIQREEPYFIRPRKDLLNQFGSQRLQEFARMWPRVEGEIIRVTLGILEWLGVARVSRNEGGKVEAFAITKLGAELIGIPGATHQEIAPTDKPLLVQPNFEIMVFAPQVNTLWTLLKFSNLKKLDQVSLYNIDRAAVLRGLESGLTATVMLEWLESRSAQPLPQNLAVSIQDWSKGFRRVMVERTVLLEVEDPVVLDELLKTKQYSQYFVRRLSPTAAVVKLSDARSLNQLDSLKAFKNKLKTGGFFAT